MMHYACTSFRELVQEAATALRRKDRREMRDLIDTLRDAWNWTVDPREEARLLAMARRLEMEIPPIALGPPP